MRVGDAEADFIVSGKNGTGIILTVACRTIRVSFLEQILDVTIPHVHVAFRRIQKRFPELVSISTDNDVLLQKHLMRCCKSIENVKSACALSKSECSD